MTLTILSYIRKGHGKQDEDTNETHLLVAAEKRACVMDYMDCAEGYALMMTSPHLQSKELLKQVMANNDSDIPVPHIFINNVDKLLSLDTINFSQIVGQKPPNTNLKIDIEQQGSFAVVNDAGKEIINVNCSFVALPTPNPFDDVVEAIEELDKPNDSKQVTVTAMMWGNNDNEVEGLFKLMAGPVDNLPSDGDVNSCRFVFREFLNDEMHDQIRLLSQDCLGQFFDKSDLESWEAKSPLFIVTTSVPENCDEESGFGLESIAITPTIDENHARKVVVFSHPEKLETAIKVEEPASPTKTKYVSGNKVLREEQYSRKAEGLPQREAKSEKKVRINYNTQLCPNLSANRHGCIADLYQRCLGFWKLSQY